MALRAASAACSHKSRPQFRLHRPARPVSDTCVHISRGRRFAVRAAGLQRDQVMASSTKYVYFFCCTHFSVSDFIFETISFYFKISESELLLIYKDV